MTLYLSIVVFIFIASICALPLMLILEYGFMFDWAENAAEIDLLITAIAIVAFVIPLSIKYLFL